MTRCFVSHSRLALLVPAALLLIGMSAASALAQIKLYNPIPLEPNKEISDRLTEKDIPTGQGGFARDYVMNMTEGDQVAIDLSSESFDTIVSLLAEDGSTVADNDDGPDGSTNSLLFARIAKTGTYIIRVRAFGETGVGTFKLKVTRLRPV
jgi:hypothetical protein